MLDSTDNYLEVHKSALNNSKAKMQYSFGKAPRFQELYKSSSCDSFYYDLPSVFSKRAASLGFGHKYDFTEGAKSKCPCFYNYKGAFDKKPNNRGSTFGAGREAFFQVGKFLHIL